MNSLNIGTALQGADSTALGINNKNGTYIDKFFASGATAASYISKIDSAISAISSRRGAIGAMENRLQSAVQSLSVRQQNLASSDSIIRDVDIAQESSDLTKNQILQQASASLLV